MEVELLGRVDEQHHLQVDLPPSFPPGPVRIVLKPVASLTQDDDDWAEAIALAWLNDWSDPREDIYTMQDGEPVDGACR